MRRWGIVVSAFYTVLIATLFWPAVVRLTGVDTHEPGVVVPGVLGPGALGPVLIALLAGGQVLLLFLTVDTSWRRLKPRQHTWISVAVVGLFIGLLALSFVSCVWAALSERSLLNSPLSPWNESSFGPWPAPWFVWLLALWALWGAAFYAYYRGAPAPLAAIIAWTLRGSVLELLVAVPTHVLVRRREDCSAPLVTGFGIATGVAVMLACFGPGVLALYKKRLDSYAARKMSPRV